MVLPRRAILYELILRILWRINFSNIALAGRSILEVYLYIYLNLFLYLYIYLYLYLNYLCSSLGYIFLYYPVDEAMGVRIDPAENYDVPAL